MSNFTVHQIDHVELFVPDVYEAARWFGHRRIAFRVSGADLLRFREHVASNPVHDRRGVETRALKPVDHDEAFSFYFADPWGNLFEITTYDVNVVRAAERDSEPRP